VINEKGKLIAKAFAWKIQGYSNTDIADKLSKSGFKVDKKRLSEILRNPFYCGYLSHNLLEGQVIKGNHEALITEEARRTVDHFELVDLKVASSSSAAPHAEVTMRVEGKECSADGEGDGMVDACYKAIYKIAGINPALERYAVKAITGGTDALGEVSCMIRENGVTVAGQGAHSDIVMASALALVNALNRLKARKHAPLKPTTDVP